MYFGRLYLVFGTLLYCFFSCFCDVTILEPTHNVFYIREDFTPGNIIFTMRVSVTTADPTVYTLSPSAAQAYIDMQDRGVEADFKFSKAVDFNSIKQISFNVTVTSGNTDEASFVINIRPLNANAPTFTPSLQNSNVLENKQRDSTVATLTCSDPDVSGAPCAITITSGDDAGLEKFKVAGNQIMTTTEPLDYETKSLYRLIIEATDAPPSGSVRTGTMTLVINVDPENEYTPMIQGEPLRRTIDEDFLPGREVIDVEATDKDTGNHGQITYSIISGNTGDAFVIEEDSGKIYTKRPLDYETTPSYTLTVQATDGGGRSSTTSVTISIGNLDDNPPVCFPNNYHQVSVYENITVGSMVLSFNCTDRDGSSLHYKVLDDDHFNMAGKELQIKKNLDYDDGTFSYYFVVDVKDTVHSTKVFVLIRLLPVNEYRPAIVQLTKTISEDTPMGAEIAEVGISDNDRFLDNVHQFSISSVENGPLDGFIIDSASGKIYLAHKLDFETTSKYTITIAVDDGGIFQATGRVFLNVQNENDNAPSCPQGVMTGSVSESEDIGHVVIASFGCTDDDGDALQYSLSQQPDDNTFTASSGSLSLQQLLNYESTAFYNIQVSVDDGTYKTEINLAITVDNENEWTPSFVKSVISVPTKEDTTVGSSITTVSATDRDKQSVTYNFRSTYSNFLLDSFSGEIFLSKPLDREVAPVHELQIVASDGSRSATATVIVNVGDVNEPPQFTETNYVFFIDENTPSGHIIGEVTAVDKDTGGSNNLLSYSIISGNDESFFHINPSTGQIQIDKPPDYEVSTKVVLVVRATDGGSPKLSGVCTTTITIRDVNDNPPSFAPDDIQKWIAEDAKPGQTVTQVSASDLDSSLNGNNKMVFSSISNVPFQVDANSGVVTVSEVLDREKIDRYELIVTATDRGNPELSGTLTISIHVTDVNDNPPSVIGFYEKSIPEDAPLDTLIFSIKVEDLDENSHFNYSILSGNFGSSFKVDAGNGDVYISSNLDREQVERYELVLQVSDMGDPSHSTTVTATVNIDDVNDVQPNFKKSSYAFSIKEHVPSPTVVGSVEATDDDKGVNSELFYSIATQWRGADGNFGINDTSGEIYTLKDLDREIESEYQIWVRVQDGGSPPLSIEITVNITIQDINDQTPMFEQQEYSTAIPENYTKGSKVLSARALDSDEGLNGEVIYELDYTAPEGIMADQFIGVRSDSGDLILKRPIDRETYQELTFPLVARDNGEPPTSSTVNVTIYILDVNDNRPEFLPQFYNTEASITDYCDATITKVIAIDEDVGDNAIIGYRITPVQADPTFQIDNSGNLKSIAELTQSTFVVNVESFDHGDPILTSLKDGLIRVDAFTPEEIVITFYLDLTLISYLTIEDKFVNHLQEVLHEVFPTSYTRRWCIADRIESVIVHVYAVKNDITNDIQNLREEKKFVTNGEFINRLQLNLNKIPTVLVDGKTWDKYKIEKVVSFGDTLVYPPPEPMVKPEETDDLALVLGLTLGLLALLVLVGVIAYFAWRRKWCKKRCSHRENSDSSKKPRVQIIEIKSLGDKDVFEDVKVGNKATETKLPSVLAVSPLQHIGNGMDGHETNGPLLNIPRPETPAFEKPSPEYNSVYSSRQDFKSVTLSPSLVGYPASNGSTPLPTNPALHNPNRGVDFVTGWVYEEDPETNVRQWIRTPDD